MSDVTVRIRHLPHGKDLKLPEYRSQGAAGLDLMAAIAKDAPIRLAPLERAAIPTGIALAIGEGYEGQVRPRSGLARDHGVTIVNAPGTIDADYRGEIVVLLINLGREDFLIERGMRVAQLVIASVARAELIAVSELDETVRGSGGFGSTGRD